MFKNSVGACVHFIVLVGHGHDVSYLVWGC